MLLPLLFSLSLVASADFSNEDPNLRDIPAEETAAGFCFDCTTTGPAMMSMFNFNTCDVDHPGPICKMRGLFSNFIVKFSLRSDTERLEYFKKYQNCKYPQAFIAYRDRYRHYTAAAADAFGLPQALLDCLVFQESQWFAQAKSYTHAFGFGQFTGNTAKIVDSMIGIVNTKSEAKASIQKLKKQIDTAEESGNEKTVRILKSRIRNRQLNEGWITYFDKLKRQSVSVKGQKTKLWNDKTPTSFAKYEDGDQPAQAIGAVALLAAYHYSLMMEEHSVPVAFSNEEIINKLALIGGFHNRGAGRLTERLGRPRPKTYGGWIKNLGKNDPEARKHMENVKRCVSGEGGAPTMERAGRLVDQPVSPACPPPSVIQKPDATKNLKKKPQQKSRK